MIFNMVDITTEAKLNLNKTTSAGSAPLFAPALNRHILTAAAPALVHQQFGQKVEVPKGQGKAVCWDKLSPLPKAKVPLVEGVTPKGSAIHVTRLTAVPEQFGDYISTTDEFDYFAIDPSPKMLKLNETLANSAARTLDSLTADVLASGTNVQYPNGKLTRGSLTDDDKITVSEIKKAVRTLKGNNAPKINNKYVAIIHTDIAHDLTSDEEWRWPHQYVDTKEIYEGEIGELYGVKFVETTEAKVFRGEDLIPGKTETLQVWGVSDDKKTIFIYEDVEEDEATAMSGRDVLIDGLTYTIQSAHAGENGEASITLDNAVTDGVKADIIIYPAGGSEAGKPVYSTVILGADAYGVTSLQDNLETIVKSLGSAGSADPLNQRATMGWKAHFLAKVLEDLNMVRLETVSSRY